MYNLACEVLVRHKDGDYLIIRSDLSKTNYGVYYEATSVLDLENTDEVLKLLQNIKEHTDIIIVFIIHEMDVAKKLFDRAAVMSNGKIVEISMERLIILQENLLEIL